MSSEEDGHPELLSGQSPQDRPRLTFYLDSPPGSPPRLSPEDQQREPVSTRLVSPGSSPQHKPETQMKTSLTSDRGNSETAASLLKRHGATSLPTVIKLPNPEGEDDDTEIKYIDEDVEEVSDNEILVKVTFKDTDTTISVRDMPGASPTAKSSVTPSKEDIMSKFEEQERSFREEFLSPSVLELSARREAEMQESAVELSQYSAPSGVPGIDNLQQLIKLIEQVSYLRQQNKQLHNKCSFLEDTRNLLQMQNDILSSKEQNRSRTLFSQRVMHYFDTSNSHSGHVSSRNTSSVKPRWERVPSDGSDILHSTPLQDKKGVGKLQRSQSDGSIDLVDMDFTSTPSSQRREHKPTREYFLTRADFHKKSRKLQQKWERVKKVFSGKPEYVAKAETSAVSAEQLVRANTKKVVHEKHRPPNLQNLPMHGELLSPEQMLLDRSPNLQDLPASPNSIHSEPSTAHGLDDDSLTYREDVECASVLKRSRSVGSIVSDSSTGNRHFLFDDTSVRDQETNLEKILYLRMEGRLGRRRSSPTISVHEQDREFMTSAQGLPRSSSVKVMKSGSDLDPDVRGGKAGRSDTANKAKAAWDRVKDIIHTRKDSLKKGKPRGTIGHAMSDGEISPDFVSAHSRSFTVDDEPLVARGDTKLPRSASPSRGPPLRVRTMKAGRNSGGHSPSRTPKRKSLAHVMLNNSPTDVAAFMGITDDFSKRMQEWEEKKKKGGLVKANSFSYDVDQHKTFDQSGATKFTEDFIKKMEEWEQMKGLTSPPKSPDPEKAKEVIHQERTSPVEVHQQATPVLHNLSESFSKTVQEWERVKERRAQGGTSPGPESRSRQRTVERSKSRERDRSRHKYEKEIQKIERKEWKIEREKQKLERMKMKLDMAMESSSGSEGFADGMAYEYVLKQLQDRDVNRAAVTQQMETRVLSSQQQESVVQADETFHTRSVSTREISDSVFHQRERVFSDSCVRPIPHRPIPMEPRAQGSGDTPSLEPGLAILAQTPATPRAKSIEKDETEPKTSSSTKSSSSIQQELEDKDDQIKDLQYDIQQLTDRISLMDREHNHKIENYKRQLRVANRMGQFSCQTYQMDASLRELRNQVEILIQAQDILVKEKQMLEKKYQSSVQEKEDSKNLLLNEIQDLQERLGQQRMEPSSTTSTTVTSLCSLITKAQAQLNHLKLALSKRDQAIKEIERHLLTQRVNNKLLEAGLQRQALEISYLREQKRKRVIKRSKTFSGHEFSIGQGGRLELKPDSRLDPGKKFMLSKQPLSPRPEPPAPDPAGSLDLHSDWLQIIKKQLEEEQSSAKKGWSSATPALASTTSQTCPFVKSTTSQTVMTLCNCPYLTINIPNVAAQAPQKVDNSTQSDCTSQEPASTQTVTTKQAVEVQLQPEKSEATQDRKEEPAIVATVTEVSIPDITASCTSVPKQGILKSSVQKPTLIPSLQERSGAKPKAAAVSVTHVKVQDEAGIKRHSYEEWLKREPKPLAVNMRRTASLDVPPDKEGQPRVEGQDSTEVFTSSEEVAPSGADSRLLSPDDIAAPQLPHSPVIRSKNLRKLKNTENRAGTSPGDARTWKATPPRRFIRHRKNMVERLSMGSMLSEGDSKALDQQADTRLRTKSDSSELQAACAIARENSFKRKEVEREKLSRTTEHISRMQNLLEVRSFVSRGQRSSSGVRDIISRYEEGKFDRSHLFRKSPSPSVPKVSVMSPRRLKTAAELLQDSIEQKEQLTYLTVSEKSATIGTPREKLPSTSSDKENSSHPAHPKGPIRQQAIDSGSPLLASRSQTKPTLLALAYSLQQDQGDRDSTDSQELVKPLKDRTNDRSKLGRTGHGEDHTTGEVPNTPPKDRAGVTKSRRNPLSALTPPTGKRHKVSSSSSPKSEPATVAGRPSTKPESTMSTKAVEAKRHMSKADSVDSSQSAWSSERDDSQPSSAWQLSKETGDQGSNKRGQVSPSLEAERKSRSKAKARFWSKESQDRPRPKSKGPHRFFDRKRTVSPSPARGAISALCMHTMTVSIEDDSTDSLPNLSNKPAVPPSPGSDPGDKRSRRGKFLDSNWFQKPKGLFKVSKMLYVGWTPVLMRLTVILVVQLRSFFDPFCLHKNSLLKKNGAI